jgi:hypothetical protein
MSMAKYQDDFYDPTILFWDASPLRGWFIRNGVIGLYTGWERVVVALIIAPLTPYFVPVFVSAIIVEQLIFVLGYIFCQRFRIGIDL